MDIHPTPSLVPPRKKIPAEVFVKIWETGHWIVNGESWISEEATINISQNFEGRKQINFSNFEIQGQISVGKDKIFRLGLLLHNCQFENVRFNNTKFGTIIFSEGTVGNDISISGSEILGVSVWSGSQIGGLFAYTSKLGDFSVRKSKTGPLWIDNSTIGNCSISNGSVVGFINLLEKSACGDVFVADSRTGNLFVENSVVGDLKFENAKGGNIEFRDNSIAKRFSFQESSIVGLFKIANATATIITVSGGSRVAKISVWHCELQRIDIKNSFVGEYKCHLNLQKPAQLTSENSTFGFINFNNSVLPEFTTINTSNCAVNKIKVSNFCNYGTVFFSGLIPIKEWEDFIKDGNGTPIFEDNKYQFEIKKSNSILHFADSDLGKIQFINCDLRKFDRFEFSNTKMLDVFVAGSQMPSGRAFCLPDEEKNILKKAEQKRLAYGQLKKIYELKGDVAGSLRYLAYEMDAYFWQIILGKPWKIDEWIMLVFNKISTNYGNNWLQGFIVTGIVVFLCFANYLRLIGYEWGEYNKENVELFKELFSYSLHYLNPFRDKDSISIDDNLYISSTARFWDLFSRIIVAYFAYQTIQAFRKLGKSSG